MTLVCIPLSLEGLQSGRLVGQPLITSLIDLLALHVFVKKLEIVKLHAFAAMGRASFVLPSPSFP